MKVEIKPAKGNENDYTLTMTGLSLGKLMALKRLMSLPLPELTPVQQDVYLALATAIDKVVEKSS